MSGTTANEVREELRELRIFAQDLVDENHNLKARLVAFEEGRSSSDFPLDTPCWMYDGGQQVLALLPDNQRIVICEMHGPPETRSKNAFLICQARSAIFWCEAHEQTTRCLSKDVCDREQKIELLRAEIAELNRITTLVPPDILPVLEALLERVGFHFKPDPKTTQLVRDIEDIVARIKAVSK